MVEPSIKIVLLLVVLFLSLIVPLSEIDPASEVGNSWPLDGFLIVMLPSEPPNDIVLSVTNNIVVVTLLVETVTNGVLALLL